MPRDSAENRSRSGIQRVKLRVDPIPYVRETEPILRRAHQRLLLFAAFPHSLVRDEGVRDLRESGLNHLLVLHQRGFTLSLGKLDV
jgi:hypothetical protein